MLPDGAVMGARRIVHSKRMWAPRLFAHLRVGQELRVALRAWAPLDHLPVHACRVDPAQRLAEELLAVVDLRHTSREPAKKAFARK